MRILNLDILKEGLPGITPANGGFLLEAAAFALISSGHSPGVRLVVEGNYSETFKLQWTHEITASTFATWTITNELVELGAVGISLLTIRALTNFTIFEKGQFGTGIDYWLGTGNFTSQSLPLFQRRGRLEITGIEKEGNRNTLAARIPVKKRQVRKTDHTGLPVFIAALEFYSPKLMLIAP